MRFVDANVLLYAAAVNPEESGKADTARRLLHDQDLCLSVQVLQEFYVQATRATRPHPVSRDQAERIVQSFLRFPVQDMTAGIVLRAVTTHQRHQISYWDAAIVEAARTAGCAVVLSEDLSPGQDYDGVLIENPFADIVP